jgi:hypothetical protein
LVKKKNLLYSFPHLLLPPPTNNIAHEPSHIPLGVLGLFPLLLRYHFPNRRQGIDPQQHPALSKQLITDGRSYLHPHFANISVLRHFPHGWLLHNPILALRFIVVFSFAGTVRV